MAVAGSSAHEFKPLATSEAGGIVSRADTSRDPASHFFSAVGNDFRHLASIENVLTIATAGGLALGIHPLDDNLTKGARGTEPLEEAFDAGAALGDGWIQVGTAIGTYTIGRLTDHPQVQAVGGDLLRAQLMSGVLTQTLKMAFDRTRPDGSSHSFPSGHASAAFATATVLQRHLGWRVALPVYGAASYVAASRPRRTSTTRATSSSARPSASSPDDRSPSVGAPTDLPCRQSACTAAPRFSSPECQPFRTVGRQLTGRSSPSSETGSPFGVLQRRRAAARRRTAPRPAPSIRA